MNRFVPGAEIKRIVFAKRGYRPSLEKKKMKDSRNTPVREKHVRSRSYGEY
jgi:hypothetical protein